MLTVTEAHTTTDLVERRQMAVKRRHRSLTSACWLFSSKDPYLMQIVAHMIDTPDYLCIQQGRALVLCTFLLLISSLSGLRIQF